MSVHDTGFNYRDQPLPDFREIHDNEDRWKARRKFLREKLLNRAMINSAIPLEYEGTFNGYADSGQYEYDSGNGEVDAILSEALYLYVSFDWYNNEGGGGDLTWNVRTDKLTINGYYNVIEKIDEMSDVEV